MVATDDVSAARELSEALAGRYAVHSLIASGGMAHVYLGTDLRHHRRVALKVTRTELLGLDGPQRFQREIAIAAKLAHPNIVPLYDSGQAGKILFFVMPYIQGESLRGRLNREGGLSIDEAVRITAEVADALEYAHRQGIVHRDIKPENILFESGHALVADFGVAKAMEPSTTDALTTGHGAVGTVAYMSPEQARGAATLDGRSDLFSLALVLHEMLGGDLHVPSPQVSGAGNRASQAAFEFGSTTVPKHVDAAIRRALASRPADRFATCAEFAQALRDPAAGEQSRRRIARLRAAIAIAGAVAVTIAVSSLVLRQRAPASLSALGRIVVAPLDNRTGASSFDALGLMAGDWITEGLQRTGAVEVVPTSTALEISRRIPRQTSNTDLLQSLAAETGARTVITGSYYRRGDSLLFHVDVATDKGRQLIESLSDIAAPVADPVRAIHELRTRLMGWLALHVDERMRASLTVGDRPPTYDAYRAFSEAMTKYIAVDNAQALPLFMLAYQIDSTFTSALLYASICMTNLGNYGPADSLLQQVNVRRKGLSAYHQAWLDYRRAFVRGDQEATMVAVRAATKLAPQSKVAYNHAVAAFQGGYVGEALTAIEALRPDQGSMRGFAPYWTIYGAILHALRDYDREYSMGTAAQRLYPDRLWQFAPIVRSLAARGRERDLDVALRAAEGIPTDPIRLDYAHLVIETAEELRAHGHEAAALRYYHVARSWLAAQSPTPAITWRIARVLYALERWEEAGTLTTQLLASDSANVDYLGTHGLVLARTGRRIEAQSISDRLARRRASYEFGAANLYRARIAAVLGDNAAALSNLRAAMAEGRDYHLWLHRDLDLAPLRGHPPFDEIVRGKDAPRR